MTMTMTKLAQLADVSQSMVSLVLNGKDNGRVSEKRRKEILNLAKKHNFRVNQAAKRLRSREKNLIGITMPVPDTSSYGTRISSLQNKLNKLNYYGVFGFWENKKQIPDTINRIMTLGVDALISWDYHPCLEKEHLPIALYEQQKGKYDCVIIDYHDYASKIIDYAKRLNHRKISVIGAAETKKTSCRFNYLCQQLPLHGIEMHAEWVSNATRELNIGHEGFANIIRKNIGSTLIITPDDLIAEGVYYKAKELKVKIPEDISIIGGDNMDICEFLTPKLNSFSINEDKLDSELIELIIRRLKNPDSSHTSISVKGNFIERESCRKI